MTVMNLDFPFHFDGRGRTAATDPSDHIRDLVEQLLFTSPGERVNRPDFGTGLLQLVFAPNSLELAATVQFTVQAAIQHWLGDLVEIQKLEVLALDSTLAIDLVYLVRGTGQPQSARFTRAT